MLFCKIVSKLKISIWSCNCWESFHWRRAFSMSASHFTWGKPMFFMLQGFFYDRKHIYKPTPISRLSPNFSGFSTWCSICWSHSWRPRLEMGSSSTQEIFPLSGQDCRNCYYALKLEVPSIEKRWSLIWRCILQQGLCAYWHSPIWCGGREECSIYGKFNFLEKSQTMKWISPPALYSLSLRSQDNSSNVSELRTMEGFFQERKEFGFLKK